MHDADESLKDIIVRSIASLAAVCDHAQAIDGQGFSKATSGPGHEIAALGSNQWTPEYWDYAARLSSHHSRQLEKSGQLDSMDAERLRQAVKGPSVAAPDIQTHWIDIGVIDGREMLVLSMPSEERLPKILRNLPAPDVYRPAGVGRLWRVSLRWAFAVEPFLGEFRRTGEGVREAVLESSHAATPEDRMLATDLPIVRFDPGRSEFIVKFAYDGNFVADVKRRGGMWQKGESWKDCTAFIPADCLGATLVEMYLDGGRKAVLHADAVEPLEEARWKEPSAEALAAAADPRLVFETLPEGKIRAVMTRYVPEFVHAIKLVPGRVYDGGAWLLPGSRDAATFLASRLDELAIPGAAEAAAALRILGEGLSEAQAPSTVLAIEDTGGKFVTVSMSQYVAEWVGCIKCLPQGSRRYDAGRKAWKVRKDHATVSELLERLQAASSMIGEPAHFVGAVEAVEACLDGIRAKEDEDHAPGMRMCAIR